MHTNTHPETVVDKNGILTTRHKRNDGLPSTVRDIPVLVIDKAISASARTSQSSTQERVVFDAVTLITQSHFPGAKSISVAEVGDRLALVAVDGSPTSDNLTEFIISNILERAGVSEGVYKLSGAVNPEKTKKSYMDVLNISNPSEARLTQGGMTEIEALGAIDAAKHAVADDLAYMTDEVENNWVRSVVANNPNAPDETLDILSNFEDRVTLGIVARRTNSPETLSRMLHSPMEEVREVAVRRDSATSEDLDWVYRNTKSATVRALSVSHSNATVDTVKTAFDSDWSNKVISAAGNRLDILGIDTHAGEVWKNTTVKSFLKDTELKSATKGASSYTNKVANGDIGDPDVIDDEQARAIAWRVASRMNSSRIPSFQALDGDADFSLQSLVSEAAYIKGQKIENRAYGLKWEADEYMNSIIGWARTKQKL